jgi:hypothetical protein
VTVQLSWPPAFSFLAASVQDLMTADNYADGPLDDGQYGISSRGRSSRAILARAERTESRRGTHRQCGLGNRY